MFANMVSSGLCVPIHQPQTHLCNPGGNLSEKRWAAESPPHCLAGPDEISKHTAVQACAAPVSPQQTQVAAVCVRHDHKLQDTFFWWYFSRDVAWLRLGFNLSNALKFEHLKFLKAKAATINIFILTLDPFNMWKGSLIVMNSQRMIVRLCSFPQTWTLCFLAFISLV